MEDYGLVSIITPSWNCASLVSDTINSILSQTYTNWELLIQDDCSTDNSIEVINGFDDSRIKCQCNDKNSGAAVTRNNALKRAQGRWVAFLDSDDLWNPTKLEKQLKFMVDNNYHFSYTAYKEMDNNGCETGVLIRGPKHVSKSSMFCFCWPGCLTVMYDRETIGLIQIADIKKNNDYAMWLKVCRKAKCHFSDEPLAIYRRGREGSVSTHGYLTMVKWHYRLWHEAEGYNPILACFYTFLNLVFGVYKKIKYVESYRI